MSDWISVKDRLPESVCLAVSGNIGGYHRGYLVGQIKVEKCDTWYICVSGSEILANVTHWMPLPEPPKEGAP